MSKGKAAVAYLMTLSFRFEINYFTEVFIWYMTPFRVKYFITLKTAVITVYSKERRRIRVVEGGYRLEHEKVERVRQQEPVSAQEAREGLGSDDAQGEVSCDTGRSQRTCHFVTAMTKRFLFDHSEDHLSTVPR